MTINSTQLRDGSPRHNTKDVPRGYKQTDVGVIPEDWEVSPLGDLGEALIGLTYKPSDVREHGTLVLRASNIQSDALAFDDNVFVGCSISERIMARPGDVLICVRNGSRQLIGKTALLDERAVGMTFGAFMAIYRSPIGTLVSYLFQSAVLKRQINEHLGATINQITNKSLKSFRIPVSPLERERRAIAAALSDVDALLGALEALIAKKRAVKQTVMQQLLSGKTRLPGFSGEWETKRLGEIAELHRQNVVPAAIGSEQFTHYSLPAFDHGQIPVREPGSAIGSNKFRVPENAVLVSKLNPRIPRVWMPRETLPNAVASTEFLVLTPRQRTSRLFLFTVCTSPEFCERLELSATGTTGSHQRVNPSDAMNISLCVPPQPDEQTAIATVLSDMDAEIGALEARRDKTHEIKQGMMQQLLTGRVRLVKPKAAA